MRFGDRKDGKKLRNIDGLHNICIDLKPRRCDADVYINQKVDVSKLVEFIEKHKEDDKENKLTYFHAFSTAFAKVFYEKPLLNRFICNRTTYERNEVVLAFVAKIAFEDDSEEVMINIKADPKDNIYTLRDKISKKVKKIRDSNIKKIEKKDYLKIIITSILLSLSLNIIIYLINKVIPITNRYDDIRILLYNIIPIGIISPIIEEYIFRGVIFNKLKTFNSKKTSIIITTLIFSIMHFELSQIIYTLIVGYYLTYLYSKTNNLKTSIISHMAINTSTLLIVPLIVNTNIYIQSGILILIILSLYQIFSIKIK